MFCKTLKNFHIGQIWKLYFSRADKEKMSWWFCLFLYKILYWLIKESCWLGWFNIGFCAVLMWRALSSNSSLSIPLQPHHKKSLVAFMIIKGTDEPADWCCQLVTFNVFYCVVSFIQNFKSIIRRCGCYGLFELSWRQYFHNGIHLYGTKKSRLPGEFRDKHRQVLQTKTAWQKPS